MAPTNGTSHFVSTTPSNPDGITGKLCNWIHGAELSDIPADTITRAKYLMLDGLACALACAQLPWSRSAAEAIFKMESEGQCTVIGWGSRRLSPLAATLLNSTLVMGFELDDYDPYSLIHSNSILIPALLAAAEPSSTSKDAPGCSGADFLRGYIVGCEVGLRVGRALRGSALMAQGWLNGSVQGPSAAAAAVSSLLRLSPAQIEWALGLACTQAGGLLSIVKGSMAKRMQHGLAARDGLFATLMAKEGFTAINEVYERPYGGFLNTFTQGSTLEPKALPDELIGGLGSRWEVNGVRIRFHTASPALHGAIDCIANLQSAYPKSFTEENLVNIESITTQHSKSAYEFGTSFTPSAELLTGSTVPILSQRLSSAQMSIKYVTATQVVHRQVSVEQFGPKNFNQPLIRELMAKIEPSYTEAFDEAPESHWKTNVTVRFKDGTKFDEYVNAPKGSMPAATNEEIVDKWRRLMHGVLDETRRDQIERCVLSLEKLDDVRELAGLLAGVAKSPFDI